MLEIVAVNGLAGGMVLVGEVVDLLRSSPLDCLRLHYTRRMTSTCPCWPTDPYLFLVWWHCGYPASDAACERGWESLKRNVGVEAPKILAAPLAELARALRAGGMVPELRARRLQEIAGRVQDEFGGDLRRALFGPLPQVRKSLKRFPNIADAGADRIMLFSGVAPVAAVPSNCPHVLVRIQRGLERQNFHVNYREAQEAIASDVAENVHARRRAYLLLKRHGQELCKRTKPKCDGCPVNTMCAYQAGKHRGRAGLSKIGLGRTIDLS